MRRSADRNERVIGENDLTHAAKSALHIRAPFLTQLRHERGQIDQILQSEPRPLAPHHHERIIRHQAGPSRRQRREVAMNGSVEHAIFAPVRAPDHHHDFLTMLRMERMRDPDRRGHLLGAGCSRNVG